MTKILPILSVFLWATHILMAQTTFADRTDLLSVNNVRSGAPMTVADLNGDFLDDIVRLNNTSNLVVEYQSTDGTFRSFEMNGAHQGAWAVCAADIDNDGMCEIMAGGAYNTVTLLRPSTDGSYTKSTLDGPAIFCQAMNFADINNDGFTDAFSCHDDGPSNIWGNNGSGLLLYNSDDYIDLALHGGGENDSGNYGSVWADFDSDGDLDLYIAKCRQGVNNPEDVRRINQLWVNDGTNHYTEAAASYGLDIGWQSWTAEFQDIDNDGDFDCFITNHDYESQLLENVGNQFIDITASSGISLSSLPIQAAMKDFDNDGYVDLLVTGHFYHNNGDNTFTEVSPNPFGNIHSFGIGDLNHDGFLDVYAGYGNGFNSTGSTPDKLWLNNTNTNNWFAVNLLGEQSNRGGIGARIELNGAWGTMTREVRAGESYGIGHSLTQHFGLGTADVIESVVVRWPSGVVDVYENPPVNDFFTIIENNCVSLDASIEIVDGETIICEGETVTLSAPAGYTYQWSNGATQQIITIEDPGNYSVTISDDMDCFGVSGVVQITENPEVSLLIETDDDLFFCAGSSIELTASYGSNFEWSTGETTPSITVTQSGMYTVSADGVCDRITSAPVQVSALPTPPAPTAQDTTITEATSVTLTAQGNNTLRWYDQVAGGAVLAEGDTFVTPILEETTSYYVEDVNEYGGLVMQGGAEEHTGTTGYSGNQYNGQIIFDCLEPFTLQTATVYTDLSGTRLIELRNSNNEVLQSKEVFVEIGVSEIELDFVVEPAENLILSTNDTVNLNNFGFESPRFQRSSNNSGGTVSYPYVIGEAVVLKNSNFGEDFYYYFYDWNIQLEQILCPSPRTEVTVVVDFDSGVYSIADNDAIRVFPNPTSEILQIEIREGQAYTLHLTDIQGRLLRTMHLDTYAGMQTYPLEVQDLPKGMYVLQLSDAYHTYTAKVVVQ